jgi:hypothetical protein
MANFVTIQDYYFWSGVVLLFVSIALLIIVRRTSWNYVRPRLKQFFRGGRFIEEVTGNSGHTFKCVPMDEGVIRSGDRIHTVVAGSALRNPDGAIFQIHENVGKAMTPGFVHAANNTARMGFTSIAHALTLYKEAYFKEDMDRARLAVENNAPNAYAIIDGVEKKIGISLMDPEQKDDFTQNLAIINAFSNDKLDGYAQKNLLDKVWNEANKRAAGGGLSAERLMSYAFAFVALICGIAFAFVVLKAQGVIN